jgi:hypothetical protein
VLLRVALQRAALRLHLVRGLPGADDHLADAPHRLRIRRHHRDRAEVVQDVLGGDRLLADPRLGERDVLGDRGIEVVAHHQHVEVLGDRVHRVRPRRIRRRRQHVRFAADLDDVGRVAAARALGVQRWIVRPLNAPIEVSTNPDSFSVSVWIETWTSSSSPTARQLSIAAGVVPQSSCSFRPITPAFTCSRSGAGQRSVALAEKPRFIGNRFGRGEHRENVPWPGVQVVA